MILIFQNKEAFYIFRDDVVVTPNIEGGSGSIFIQEEPAMAADGVRCCIEHPFSEIDVNWLEAYTADNSSVPLFVTKLPEDWYHADSV